MSATKTYETRGRPKDRPKTIEEFRAAIMKYHKECEEANDGAGIAPDIAGLRLFLGYRKSELAALMKGDSEFAAQLRDLFDEASDMRESWLVRKMTSDNKRAIGCMNLLKQPDNGGYIDKAVDTGERTLTINVAGIKGGAKAFK